MCLEKSKWNGLCIKLFHYSYYQLANDTACQYRTNTGELRIVNINSVLTFWCFRIDKVPIFSCIFVFDTGTMPYLVYSILVPIYEDFWVAASSSSPLSITTLLITSRFFLYAIHGYFSLLFLCLCKVVVVGFRW